MGLTCTPGGVEGFGTDSQPEHGTTIGLSISDNFITGMVPWPHRSRQRWCCASRQIKQQGSVRVRGSRHDDRMCLTETEPTVVRLITDKQNGPIATRLCVLDSHRDQKIADSFALPGRVNSNWPKQQLHRRTVPDPNRPEPHGTTESSVLIDGLESQACDVWNALTQSIGRKSVSTRTKGEITQPLDLLVIGWPDRCKGDHQAIIPARVR